MKNPTEEQIRKRAYDLYVKSGCKTGRDVQNWSEAEKELKQMPDDDTEETDRERKSTRREDKGKGSATSGSARNQEFKKGF
jgi:DUF2934 family protein